MKLRRLSCALGGDYLSPPLAVDSQRLRRYRALGMFQDIGVIFVAIFFFSGYGLFKSFKTKDNYLKGFFRKRMPTVLVPFYMFTFIFVIYYIIKGRDYGIWEWVWKITGWHPINEHMWYIIEIVVLYVIFFLIFRFIKRENAAIAIIGIATAAIVMGSLLLGHDPYGRYWFMDE